MTNTETLSCILFIPLLPVITYWLQKYYGKPCCVFLPAHMQFQQIPQRRWEENLWRFVELTSSAGKDEEERQRGGALRRVPKTKEPHLNKREHEWCDSDSWTCLCNRCRLEERRPAWFCPSCSPILGTLSLWQPCIPLAWAKTSQLMDEPVRVSKTIQISSLLEMVSLKGCVITPVRSFGWSQEPASVEPHHDHPERALGARRGPCERVQSDLCPRCWRSRERGKAGGRVTVLCSGSEMFLLSPLSYLVWRQLKVWF